jgi:hypothetical protein
MEVGVNKKSEIKWALRKRRNKVGFEEEKRKWSFERGGRERQNVKKKQREEIGRNNKQFVAVVCC